MSCALSTYTNRLSEIVRSMSWLGPAGTRTRSSLTITMVYPDCFASRCAVSEIFS